MTQGHDADDQRELEAALRAAVHPEPIAKSTNDALIRQALAAAPRPGELLDTAEQREAEQLRQALDHRLHHPLLEAASVLRNAAHPERASLHPFVERRFLQQALSAAQASSHDEADGPGARNRNGSAGGIGGGRLRRAPVLAALGLAAAAAFLIWFRASTTPEPAVALRVERSTEPLLSASLAVAESSQRMDRISENRIRDYRANRYLAWGVQ